MNHYEAIGVSDRVRARKLTRLALGRNLSPAGWCVWRLWMASREVADAYGVPEMPVALLSPRDELARQWVDRCVELVRAWQSDVKSGATRRTRRRTGSWAEG